jgi:Lrp/AsnC family transcriptional regulator
VDNIDRKILAYLQEDATAQIETIADKVGLSASPCWRRIRKLENAGYISARVALLDPKKMNVRETVFVMVRTSNHSKEWADRFCTAMSRIPEIVEIHRTSGATDYILRVVVPDVATFNDVYRRMIAEFQYLDITSSFSMERIKSTTALPVGYAE